MASGCGRVSQLFVAVAPRQPMREMQQVLAVANKGFQSCIHGKHGSPRQVLLVDTETLAEFGLAPGVVKENVTTEGLGIGTLNPGEQLRIGEALLEVTGSCEPCHRMDEIRMGLQRELEGRRGILCRVIKGGTVCRGDAIELLESGVWNKLNGGKA